MQEAMRRAWEENQPTPLLQIMTGGTTPRNPLNSPSVAFQQANELATALSVLRRYITEFSVESSPTSTHNTYSVRLRIPDMLVQGFNIPAMLQEQVTGPNFLHQVPDTVPEPPSALRSGLSAQLEADLERATRLAETRNQGKRLAHEQNLHRIRRAMEMADFAGLPRKESAPPLPEPPRSTRKRQILEARSNPDESSGISNTLTPTTMAEPSSEGENL